MKATPMDKLKMHTPDLTEENIRKIAAAFPGCVTEAAGPNGETVRRVDFDALRQELSDAIVEGPQERYRLDWPGKRQALVTANTPIAKTLRPCREESVDFDTTKNLFIEGDNLDALKLLQETYLGKVKMIYIDPPYNTGNDFIYEDDFAEGTEEYLRRSNQKDEDGDRLVANTEANGRFHSDWLSMMYPRLKLARNLLRDDGVIFISISNEEFSSLKTTADEIFGEDNFIECITWNKRIPKNDKGVGNIHDFILIYSKHIDSMPDLRMYKDGISEIYEFVDQLKRKKVDFEEAENQLRNLYNKKGYDRGITLYNSFDKDYKLWGKINMSWPNARTFGPRYDVLHPITGTPVKVPDRGWRWKESTFNEQSGFKDKKYNSVEHLHDGSVICKNLWFSPNDKQQPSSILYLDDVNSFLLRSIISLKSDGGIENENLFNGKSIFSYPKPTSLLKIFVNAVEPDDNSHIVLDFFAGSATTAHAILDQNAADGGNRQFIMVQLPETTDEKSEAHKAGYATIAEISKERIRRAGAKVLEGDCHENWSRDVGFRVLKVDTSNMADTHYTADETEQADLLSRVENIRPDRSGEDLLFQVLVDWGVDLTLPIRRETVAGKTVFFVAETALLACFDTGVTEALVSELARHQPLRIVFRNTGFDSDDTLTNVTQIFAQLSPETDVRVI